MMRILMANDAKGTPVKLQGLVPPPVEEGGTRHLLYQTRCRVNGKIYVGIQTIQDGDDHIKYLGSGTALAAYIGAYGEEEFEKEILDEYPTLDAAREAEAELVTDEFCDREDTMNLIIGGKRGWKDLTDEEAARCKVRWERYKVERRELYAILTPEQRKSCVAAQRKLHYKRKIGYGGKSYEK